MNEDSVDHFQNFAKNEQFIKQTKAPVLQKLKQLGKKMYVFVNDSFELFIVEIHIYILERKPVSFKLTVPFKITGQKRNYAVEIRILFKGFNFQENEICFKFDFPKKL